jgi:amino acid transporter
MQPEPNEHLTIEEKLPSSKKLSFLALVSLIFFTVSGGAFGIEPLVAKLGAFWAVTLIIITPLLWSLPIALIVSELASAMPHEGGYYLWVRRALGDFWGFQEGWWTICYTAVDMSIYPVLFANYLAFFFPSLALDGNGNSDWSTFWKRWGIAAGLVFLGFLVNFSGVRNVGRNAITNVALVIFPFVLLVVFSFTRENSFQEQLNALRSGFRTETNAGLIAGGLATVLWNYCGWDNVSTFAGEVRDAARNYPRALFTALPFTVCAYLFPVLAGISVTTDEMLWNESAGFPAIASAVNGEWLGVLIAAAALISAWSLFNSQLLYVSRLPYAMAESGWLPRFLTKISKTNVPVIALALSCLVSALFAALPFGKLVIVDILLYSAALILEFIAFLVLRKREPEMTRPFCVRGGWRTAIMISVLPTAFAAVVLVATLADESGNYAQLILVTLAILSGIFVYFLRKNAANGFSKTMQSHPTAER